MAIAIAAIAVTATTATGCADRPYKSKKSELSSKLAAIRAAVRVATDAGAKPPLHVRPAPTSLTPPPVVGNQRVGDAVNATIFQSEILPSLGTGKQFKHDFHGTDGSWCLAEAASVVESGKFIEETEGHSSANSQKCADFVLRLRYLVVVKTIHIDRGESVSAYFDGIASLVDLDTQKVLTSFAVNTQRRGEVSAPHLDKNGKSYAVLLKAAGDPTVPAEVIIETELEARFPGSKMLRDDFK